MSQTIVIVHHTFVELSFEHRSKVFGCQCQGWESFKAFEGGSTFISNKCLDRLDFAINRWFFFNSNHFHDFPDGSLTNYILPPQHPLAQHNRLAQFCNDSHRWALVKRVASSFICFPLCFIETKGLENDMSKVHTYQLSVYQRLRFKVRAQAGDNCSWKWYNLGRGRIVGSTRRGN